MIDPEFDTLHPTTTGLDDRPPAVALALLLDGVPRQAVADYLLLVSIAESWPGTDENDTPSTRADPAVSVLDTWPNVP